MNHKLFRSVKYWLPETLPETRCSELAQALGGNGGERVDSIGSATHIITNSIRFQGWQDVPDAVEIVSEFWVDRTMILGELLPCKFYSADPAQLCSGVVACGSGISASDLPNLEAGITALGGQWRIGFTKDVTHLFATSTDSDKYALAMRHQETTHIVVLLPHWFDDSQRLGCKLPITPYEWPDPKVLRPLPSEEEEKIQKAEKSARKLSVTKRAFYKTAIWDPFNEEEFPPAEPAGEIWGGRKILLSPSLGLEDERRRVLEEAVEAAGGLILYYASDNKEDQEEEECERVSECDVLVTRWRAGKAFFQAFEELKIVGTLNWVFYVHATGVLSSPMDHLLHYPVRKIPVGDDFTRHKITVTNYTGEARDYLKRLIQVMGATFTPAMSGSNTVLIAAHMGGIKTTKALSWNIAVVNHFWLEDCFEKWRDTTLAIHKYIDFPPNLDFAPLLGERRVKLTRDDLATEEDEDMVARAQPPSERPPVGTEASAKEVERILGKGDAVMADQDDEEREECMAPASVSPTKHRSSDEYMDVDPVSKPSKSSKRSKKPPPSDEDSKTTPSKRGKQPPRSDGDAEMDSPTEGRRTSARKGKERLVDAEEEEDAEMTAATPAKGKGKGKEKEKPRKTNKVMFAPETDSPGPSTRTSKKSNAIPKRKAQLMESASNDEVDGEEAESPPPKKRAKSDKVVESTALSFGQASSSSGKRKMTAGPGRDSSPRKIPRTESLHVLADERVNGAKAPSKKPDASSAVASSSKSQRSSTGAKKTARTETEDEEDEVMSDVVNVEGGRTQRSRVSAGKQRDDVESADEMPPPKATKPKSKAAKKATPNSSPTRASRKSTSTVRIMTTSTTLPDAVTKTLAKLGAKSTTKVSECTHLIAPRLVRTEKLLCALAGGALILEDKWAIDSAAANTLLSEDDYILFDKEIEKKWNFRLPEAMARAKEVGGKLFENMSFYVTPKVSVDTKLLKNVVTSQGGKLLTQTPTVRIINSMPDRFVISCPEDVSIWRPFAKDIKDPIYTQELLLAASMTQQIDWKNPAFQVPQSE
ncbi:BRCT domain-containing protein [Mycena alexandri]|uniref:BRCT domain-containing protein n=1 Tax=Mycena alexandri TaxID=1745969 RepID=A0AAD6THX1_9AGAR|nr:BRCT domain-containing protein [Mycena alexandri]